MKKRLKSIVVLYSHVKWYADALKQLEELDAEVTEEGLPEISSNTKEQAKMIIKELKNQSPAPIIYLSSRHT